MSATSTAQVANRDAGRQDSAAAPPKPITLYDDFNHKWLDNTKWWMGSNCWTGYAVECVREIRNGKLRLAVGNFGEWWTGSDEGSQFAQSDIYFPDPWTISGIRADVSIDSFSGVSCATNPEPTHGQVWITGSFFNAGTAGDPNNDVRAYLHFQIDANEPRQIQVGAYWSTYGGDSSGWVDVGRFPGGGVLTGELRWDQASHQFVFAVTRSPGNSPVQVVVPYWLPDDAPAAFPEKAFSADAISPNCSITKTSAHIDASIDNVIITP
jgi:hypothetical protein